MIDIHTHILPRIDDGVTSDEAAIELASNEARGGTKVMFATPHIQTDINLTESPQIVERVAVLQDIFRSQNIPVTVLSGAEVDLSVNIVKGLDEGLPITLAGKGKHILIDLPMTFFPMNMDEILFEIQSRGVVPILAHPERAGPFQMDPERLEGYVERGICCQINARSLRGKYGPRAEECAVMFLEKRLAHFVASDAHAPRPQPILAGGRDDIGDVIDDGYWTLLTETSGECVVNGLDLPKLPAIPPKKEKKGLFRRLFGGGD